MKKSKNEPLRSLPRDMSLKYAKDLSSTGSTQSNNYSLHHKHNQLQNININNNNSNSSGSSSSNDNNNIGNINNSRKQQLISNSSNSSGSNNSTGNINNNNVKSSNLSTKTMSIPASSSDGSKSYTDSMGVILNSGPLAMIRGLENRNSGGSSSVATPNSPQQSPLSCSSTCGVSNTSNAAIPSTVNSGNNNNMGIIDGYQQYYNQQHNQPPSHEIIADPHYSSSPAASSSLSTSSSIITEDGLCEEELRQIATRQHRQIQLQHEDIQHKQQRISLLLMEIDRNAARIKISSSIIKLKELFERQELKLKGLRNVKHQASQNKSNFQTLKNDISNFHTIINSKRYELKRLEKINEDRRDYIRQKHIASSSMPPDFEAYIRHKNSYNIVGQQTQSTLLDSQYPQHPPHNMIYQQPNPSDNVRLFVRQHNPPDQQQHLSSSVLSSLSTTSSSTASSFTAQHQSTSNKSNYNPNIHLPTSSLSNACSLSPSIATTTNAISAFPLSSHHHQQQHQHQLSSDLYRYVQQSNINQTLPLSSNISNSAVRSSSTTPSHQIPPPLPEHSYQKSTLANPNQNNLLQTCTNNSHHHYHNQKRPPPPSYSDATIISARYCRLLAQAADNNMMRTPTSSPPVVRRLSIVGLPSGKVPSRFASRNTINNVYTKKSSLETLEKYKRTASEIYKAQLSQFKSSSTDDVRQIQSSGDQFSQVESNKLDNTNTDSSSTTVNIDDEPLKPSKTTSSSLVTDCIGSELTGSICSSNSSLSLPDDLAEMSGQQHSQSLIVTNDTKSDESTMGVKVTDTSVTISTGTTTGGVVGAPTTLVVASTSSSSSTTSATTTNTDQQQLSTSFIENQLGIGSSQLQLVNDVIENVQVPYQLPDNLLLDEEDELAWQQSVLRALDALKIEPTKHILKRPNKDALDSSTTKGRKAFFHPHSLLLDAALEAEFDLVKEMADKVKDISEATDEGITALHNAVCSGREDVVQFLLGRGARVNAGDTDGWTPLHCAASCNSVSMARLLVEHGASLFACSLSDGETPLQKCEPDDMLGGGGRCTFDGDDVDDDDEDTDMGNNCNSSNNMDCEKYLIAQQEQLGIANDGKVFALFEYEPQQSDELALYPNMLMKVIDRDPANENGWYLAQPIGNENEEKVGLVAKAYVSLYQLILPQTCESKPQTN